MRPRCSAPPIRGGLAAWVARLEAGLSREKLATAFTASPEAQRACAPALAAWMAAQGADDLLHAEGGDVLSGGLYADRFVFVAGGAGESVTVTDLEPWDALVFEGFGMTAAGLFGALRQQGPDVVLETGAERVVLAHTRLSDLAPGMIEIA